MLRNREGFTLIELLIVVVIIGILAAIALPKFGQTRERAYVSAMQSDLRNLQSVQEMYYPDANYNYAHSVAALQAAPYDFLSTAGVAIVVDDGGGLATSEGYGATATHAAYPGASCSLVVGGGAPQPINCTLP